MNQHNPHAHGGEERNVVDQGLQVAEFHQLARKANHKGFVAKSMDIGCNGPQPGDKADWIRELA